MEGAEVPEIKSRCPPESHIHLQESNEGVISCEESKLDEIVLDFQSFINRRREVDLANSIGVSSGPETDQLWSMNA